MFRKMMLIVLASFCVTLFTPAFAADKPDQKGTTVSTEDAKKLKDTAKVLGTVFGVDVPKEEAKAEEKKEEPKKTLADVADRGLDMVQSFVTALSETLKKIAPEVWRVMVRQQYAKAFSYLIVPWGLLFMTLAYMNIVKRYWLGSNGKEDEDAEHAPIWFKKILPLVVVFICAVWGLLNLKDSVLLFYNPEYYAIQDLLTMILRKQ